MDTIDETQIARKKKSYEGTKWKNPELNWKLGFYITLVWFGQLGTKLKCNLSNEKMLWKNPNLDTDSKQWKFN